MISFIIPYPPTKAKKSAFCRRFGLNAYYAGKHPQVRRRDSKELHQLAALSMQKAGIRRQLMTGPVEVRFFWDDGLDVDNHAVMRKVFLDAMKTYILPDDSRKWVRKVSHEFWDGGKIRVEIWTDHSGMKGGE